MQIRTPNLKMPARRAAEGVAAAPLVATLALASAVITAVVTLGTLSDGRLPANAPIGMVCAVVLAALAAVEASRPARVERVRRRVARPLGPPQDRRW